MGGDTGVFAHGDNAIEMELMVEYGMKAIDVLRSFTVAGKILFNKVSFQGKLVFNIHVITAYHPFYQSLGFLPQKR